MITVPAWKPKKDEAHDVRRMTNTSLCGAECGPQYLCPEPNIPAIASGMKKQVPSSSPDSYHLFATHRYVCTIGGDLPLERA